MADQTQPKPGTRTQSAPNRFPRGGTVPKGQTKPGYPDQSAPNDGVKGGKIIEGQNLRGYVAASSASLPTEDGNMRPDGSERTIREVPAP